MKQSSQLPLVSISWTFHEYPRIRHSVMLRTNKGPANIKMNSVPEGLNASSPKYSRLFFIFWKSVHPFFHNVAIKHRYPQNVLDCSLSHIQPALKISCKLALPCFRNVASRHRFLWQLEKKLLVCRGLNGTFPKCYRMFLVPSPTYPENFTVFL